MYFGNTLDTICNICNSESVVLRINLGLCFWSLCHFTLAFNHCPDRRTCVRCLSIYVRIHNLPTHPPQNSLVTTPILQHRTAVIPFAHFTTFIMIHLSINVCQIILLSQTRPTFRITPNKHVTRSTILSPCF